MKTVQGTQTKRLAWIEGIRIFAAVMLLLYHAQLLFTDYAFTPKPTGLADNLRLIALASDRLGLGMMTHFLSTPVWFGFQFVDVFVLISGFSLVLSLKDQPLEFGSFLKRRFWRLLLPFWTVAWLAYPILWAIGLATNSYYPDAWQTFAGATFPFLFDYSGELLVRTSGPWWFLPLIISFTLIFPVLWKLLNRWGARNLLIMSVLVTVIYRALAVYQFGGHPTYVVLDTAADWYPFLSFLSKLSTFVVGMVAAQAYLQGKGPLFWSGDRALWVGIPVYIVGFICQFYTLGWVFADLLLPIGLTLCCMAIFRELEKMPQAEAALLWLGMQSYYYFLIHDFVVNRTLELVIQDNRLLYYLLLPVMVVGTLVLSLIASYVSPFFKGIVLGVIRDIDYVLTQNPEPHRRSWNPKVGDRVFYQGEKGWTVLQVERLLDEQTFYLCQIRKRNRVLWVNEEDIDLDREDSQSKVQAKSSMS
jgi:peptidoglycan/LPS O-acetylase OafA/YrhL